MWTDNCSTCSLGNKTRVIAELKEDPTGLRLAVIGGTPGADEFALGTPFSSKSGKVLREALKAAGHNVKQTYFTYAISCKPPALRPLSSEEKVVCKQRLLDELLWFKPDRILCTGEEGYNLLFDTSHSVTDLRSLPRLHYPTGAWVMVTHPPSFVVRATVVFPDFCKDILQITGKLPLQRYKPRVVVIETEQQAESIYTRLLKQPVKDTGRRSIDIETDGLDPRLDGVLSVGISPNNKTSYIFPGELICSSPVAWGVLQRLFRNRELYWVGHNSLGFDQVFLDLQLDLIVDTQLDTMLAHYCVDERKGTHGLKELSRELLGVKDYSKVLKKFLLGEKSTYRDIPRDLLYNYQAMDTVLTWELSWIMDKLLDEEGTRDVLMNVRQPAARTLGRVQLTGAMIDREYLEDVGEYWRVEIERITEEIRVEGGVKDINLRSPKQVADLLYNKLRLPRVAKDSTAAEVLEEIERRTGDPILKKILLARQLSQIRSTYVEGILKRIDEDGRVRSNFLVHVAETSRLASRDPNLQNIPKLIGPFIRNAFITSQGWILVELDYSQLELRVAAWLSRDPTMIEAFESGVDIHRVVAGKVFHKPPEEVTELERYIAKFVDFGIVYGRGAESLATGELQCSIKEAQTFIDEFLDGFPQLKEWISATQKSVKELGYVQSAFGHKRRFPLILDRYWGEISREAINTPIQSMASDICLTSLGKIHKLADPSRSRILLTVHDSILLEIREDVLQEEIAWIQDIMEHPDIEYRVPIKVDIAVGDRWGKLEKLSKKP